jgi:AraC-like DNA-binding protein
LSTRPTGELAALQQISERQLHRNFFKTFGASPVEVYQLVRTAQVLRGAQRSESLAQLAADLGFADQSHMNRVFQRVLGNSVGRHTQQLRSNRFCKAALALLRETLVELELGVLSEKRARRTAGSLPTNSEPPPT